MPQLRTLPPFAQRVSVSTIRGLRFHVPPGGSLVVEGSFLIKLNELGRYRVAGGFAGSFVFSPQGGQRVRQRSPSSTNPRATRWTGIAKCRSERASSSCPMSAHSTRARGCLHSCRAFFAYSGESFDRRSNDFFPSGEFCSVPVGLLAAACAKLRPTALSWSQSSKLGTHVVVQSSRLRRIDHRHQ